MNDDYKAKLNTDVSDLLREFIGKHNMKPKQKIAYQGKVVDNADPEKLGRIKIRVFGVMDNEDIPISDLPYAKPEQSFIGSTVGNFIIPPVDTIVRVYFEDDDIYSPVYTTKVVNTEQIPTTIEEDYPNTMALFETDNGDYFIINRATMEAEFHHSSGLTININAEGNITISTSETDTGDLDINIKGNIKFVSDTGNISFEAPTGKILLGGDSATQPVLNVPVSDFTGSPHSIGQQFPGTPGATYIRP